MADLEEMVGKTIKEVKPTKHKERSKTMGVSDKNRTTSLELCFTDGSSVTILPHAGESNDFLTIT